MARRRKRDVEAVLRGGAADLSELVTLVHRVNPTGLPLPERERRRRYAQKAALQSRILRDFPEHTSVEPDPRHPELLVLHTAVDGRDAGHVVLEHLDEDLLPALRSQLGQAATSQGRESDPRSEAPPGPDPLAEAQRLHDAWDYVGAAEAFAAAAQGGSIEAARRCLDLRVEMLGDLAAARRDFRTLPSDLRADSTVRCLLGLAEARAGEGREAERLAGDASGEGAGAVWEALARRAIRPSEVHRLLGRMLAADPSRRQVELELKAELARRRAERRAPFEAGVVAALAQGDAGEIELALRRLLAAFPGDAWATEQRRVLERRRSEQRARTLADRAHEAERRGELEGALRLLRQARHAGLDGLEPQIADLEDRRAAAHRAAQVREVATALSAGPTPESVARWIALGLPDVPDHETLALVRAAPKRLQRHAERLAAAACAVPGLRKALEQNADVVLPHRDILEVLAPRLVAHLDAAAERREETRAGTRLEEARAALACQDVAAAEAQLEEPVPSSLRDDWRALRKQARHLREHLEDGKRFERELASERPWRARDLAAQRLADTGNRVWERRLHRARHTIAAQRRCWRWRSTRRGVLEWAIPYTSTATPWLIGDAVYLATTIGDLVELREHDLQGRPRRALQFRVDEVPGKVTTRVSGDQVWILCRTGAVAMVERSSLELVRWGHLAGNLFSVVTYGDVGWATLQDTRRGEVRQVCFEPGTLRVLHEARRCLWDVPGLPGPVVVDAGTGERTVVVADPAGRRVRERLGRLPEGIGLILGFAPGPASTLMLTRRPSRPGEHRFAVWWLAGEHAARIHELSASSAAAPQLVRGSELVYIHCVGSRLVALDVDGRAAVERWSVDVPAHHFTLVQEAPGSPVYALWTDGADVRVTPLRPNPPAPFRVPPRPSARGAVFKSRESTPPSGDALLGRPDLPEGVRALAELLADSDDPEDPGVLHRMYDPRWMGLLDEQRMARIAAAHFHAGAHPAERAWAWTTYSVARKGRVVPWPGAWPEARLRALDGQVERALQRLPHATPRARVVANPQGSVVQLRAEVAGGPDPPFEEAVARWAADEVPMQVSAADAEEIRARLVRLGWEVVDGAPEGR